MNPKPQADLAYGIAAVAAHLGIRPRQALYLKESRRIPIALALIIGAKKYNGVF